MVSDLISTQCWACLGYLPTYVCTLIWSQYKEHPFLWGLAYIFCTHYIPWTLSSLNEWSDLIIKLICMSEQSTSIWRLYKRITFFCTHLLSSSLPISIEWPDHHSMYVVSAMYVFEGSTRLGPSLILRFHYIFCTKLTSYKTSSNFIPLVLWMNLSLQLCNIKNHFRGHFQLHVSFHGHHPSA